MVNRAKIFQPFDALRGFQEALRAKERVIVKRKELTDDMAGELNWKFHSLQEQDVVTVTWYEGVVYRTVTGEVSQIDLKKQRIRLDDLWIDAKDMIALDAG